MKTPWPSGKRALHPSEFVLSTAPPLQSLSTYTLLSGGGVVKTATGALVSTCKNRKLLFKNPCAAPLHGGRRADVNEGVALLGTPCVSGILTHTGTVPGEEG